MRLQCDRCGRESDLEAPSSTRGRPPRKLRYRCVCGNMIVRDLGGEAERQAALAAATPTLHASPLPPQDEATAEPTELALPTPAVRAPPPPPVAAPPPSSPPPPIQLNHPPPASPLLRQEGRVYSVPDVATLQRWILERRVTAEDQVNLTGEGWQPVQSQPELEVFFRTLARLDELEYRQTWSGDPQASAGEPAASPSAPAGEPRPQDAFFDDDAPMSLGGVTEERARGRIDPLVRTQEAPWRRDSGYNALSDSIQETVEIRHGGLRPVDDSDIGEPTEIAQPFTRDPTDEIAPAAIFVPSKPAESPFAQAMGPSLEASDTATTTLRELTPEPRLSSAPKSAAPKSAAVEQDDVELSPTREDDPEESFAAGGRWGNRALFGAAIVLLLGIAWWTSRPDPNPGPPTPTPAAPVVEAPAPTTPETAPTPTPEAPAAPTAVDPPKPTPPPSQAGAAKTPATTPPKPPPPEPAVCATAKSCSDLGWKAIGAERYGDGRVMFIEALAIDPKNADAHYGMGYAALRQGDTATALRKFCQARQYAGNNADLAAEVQALIVANNGTCD
ncbi:MAG: tetratricopeptide repeat protein [Deltaproteobacteria bacterium]|nr:tetratricopeptide repeat protein [Deltaproteobacteria bacterium]